MDADIKFIDKEIDKCKEIISECNEVRKIAEARKLDLECIRLNVVNEEKAR